MSAGGRHIIRLQQMAPQKSSASKGKVPHHLVALSSAAVLAIYTVGYQRTRTAAEELDAAMERRPVAPVPMPNASVPVSPSADVAVTRPQVAEEVSVVSAKAGGGAPLAPTLPSPGPAATTATTAALAPTAPAPPVAVEAAPSVAPTVVAENAAPGDTAPTAAAAAPASAAPTPAPSGPTLSQYRDGTYHAWGRSRHGDVYAFVVIEHGRIVHSGYDKCQTRWSCTLIDHLGPQVVKRQSAEVDFVSGATESGNAFYWGVVEALAKAKFDAPVAPSGDSATDAP